MSVGYQSLERTENQWIVYKTENFQNYRKLLNPQVSTKPHMKVLIKGSIHVLINSLKCVVKFMVMRLSFSSDFSDTNTSREYAIPDMIRSSVIVNIPPPPPPPPRRPQMYGVNPSFAGPSGAGPSQYYTISEVPNIQVCMASNFLLNVVNCV